MIAVSIITGSPGCFSSSAATRAATLGRVPPQAVANRSGAAFATDHKRADDTTPAKQHVPRAGTKQAMPIELLRAPDGATMDAIMAATGWQAHRVRSAMSRALGNKLGLIVTSARVGDGARGYRISAGLA